MKRPKIRERLRYRFDNFIAKGGSRIFTLLLFIFLICYAIIGGARVALTENGLETERSGDFFQQMFIAFLQMTDPGNMAQDIESSPWVKIPSVFAGVIGIVLLSALIAFITTALIDRMEALKKGRSRVIEEDHTLILGWQQQRVVEIIRELIIANESESDAAVVILADQPKEEMDAHLNLMFRKRGATRIITRSGGISSLPNLDVVSVGDCKSVIVLASASEEADREEKNQSDAQTVKAILALGSACDPEERKLNIVAEIFDSHHHEILAASCGHRIEVVDANEILAKVLVQTSRSVGLSVAYGEILSFDGCEMYFHDANWKGITFGEALYRFPDGVLMGIRKESGELLIKPPPDMVLNDGDDVLILAQDDSTIKFKRRPVVKPKDHPLKQLRLDQRIENELIIGWNLKGPVIVREYAEYVQEGSRIDVIIQNPSAETAQEIEQLNVELEHITVELHQRDPLLPDTILDAKPGTRDNIIILSGGEEADPEKADAYTILLLLLLRNVLSEHVDETVNTRLITEVMDSANRSLIAQTGVKDFIISNRFISMLIAQVSEEPDIHNVYDQLFEEDGSEIYLKPVSLYFEEIPKKLRFGDCMAIALKRDEICLGVKIKAEELMEDKNFGVRLVPDKNSRLDLTPEDCLVVLAEDEA